MKIGENTSPMPLPNSGEPKLSPEEDKKIKEVSQRFEALFVNHMVNEMRKTVARSSLIPESQGERVYRSMLDQEYSESISKSDQIGLARIVYDQLLRNASGK